MHKHFASVLENPVVRAALKQAWRDSNPGVTGGHEEGGFVVRDANGELSIIRWLGGAQNTILVLPHPDCKIEDKEIVASFHTHPNTGTDFLQEPSETDIRAVREDANLKGATYEGEFVVSQEIIYLIMPTGQVREIGRTQELLAD